jgi:DNA-binding MarR family transcriptional regulator
MANHIESFWGDAILDAGWTIIPNLLSRNIKKMGIEYGEFVLICNILSHKHDTRDPYPSQELLAEYQGVSVRQVQKLVKSLREKGYLKTGRRRNKVTGNWISSVYSFEPLLKKLNVMASELYGIKEEEDVEIVWDDDENSPHEHEVRVATRTSSSEPHEHEVRVVKNTDKPNKIKGSQAKTPHEHEVRTKMKIEKDNINMTNNNNETPPRKRKSSAVHSADSKNVVVVEVDPIQQFAKQRGISISAGTLRKWRKQTDDETILRYLEYAIANADKPLALVNDAITNGYDPTTNESGSKKVKSAYIEKLRRAGAR